MKLQSNSNGLFQEQLQQQQQQKQTRTAAAVATVAAVTTTNKTLKLCCANLKTCYKKKVHALSYVLFRHCECVN